MTTAQVSRITPPPSVEAVLSALTEQSRIGQVDFSSRLAPEPADTAPAGHSGGTGVRRTPAEELSLVADPVEDDEAEREESHSSMSALRAMTEPEPVVEDAVATPQQERSHEPAPPAQPEAERVEAPGLALPELEERPPSVEEIARLVVERMHDAELAMMRHLEAIEAEAARRAELLTAQAELDAELIRLNARREAHHILTRARQRAQQGVAVSQEQRQVEELTESLTRFADVVDELRPSAPSRSGRMP